MSNTKVFFARIIELPENQVLLTKVKTDDLKAPVALQVMSDILGKRVTMNYGFTEQSHVDDAFSSFSMKDATTMVEDATLRLEEQAAGKTEE